MLKIREVKDNFFKSLSNFWNTLGTPDCEKTENGAENAEIELPTDTQSRLNALELLVDPKYKAKAKKEDSQSINREKTVVEDGGKKVQELDHDEREL